ncbi:hypothetical protein CBL_20970 [Carabus blaptoides fortunei]
MAGYDELVRLAAIADVEIAEQNAVVDNHRFRTCENAFRLSDRQFVRIFRLSKMLTNNLIEIVEPYIRPQSRISALDITTKEIQAIHMNLRKIHPKLLSMNVIAKPGASLKDTVLCIKNNLPNVEEDLEDVDYGMFLAPQQAEVQDVAVGRVNPQLAEARIIRQ